MVGVSTINCEGKSHTSNHLTCGLPALWWVQFHCVDDCLEHFVGDLFACQECFNDIVDASLEVLTEAKKDKRPMMCTVCKKPLVRLSNIIHEVERV